MSIDINTDESTVVSALNNKADTDLNNILPTNSILRFRNRGIVRYDTNKKWFVIQNCLEDGDLDKGPFSLLFDADRSEEIDDNTPGSYVICGRIDEKNKAILTVRPDGTLIKDVNKNSEIMTTSIIDSIVDIGSKYIRYDSGIQICWGLVNGSSGVDINVTFPKEFINIEYSLTFGRVSNETTSKPQFYWARAPLLTTGFKFYTDIATTANYLAVGYWK